TDPLACEGATDELRYETDVTYTIPAMRPRMFVVEMSFYAYAGGAHGMGGLECDLADADKGTLTKLNAKLVAPASRAKLQDLTNAALRKSFGVTKLTDAMFFEDEAKISDETTLCVRGAFLVVQFGQYEVAPYAMGMPSAEILKADAAPLVAGTALEPFFK